MLAPLAGASPLVPVEGAKLYGSFTAAKNSGEENGGACSGVRNKAITNAHHAGLLREGGELWTNL